MADKFKSTISLDKKFLVYGLILISCSLILLSGCSLPWSTSTPAPAESLHTVVAETIIAEITMSAQPPTQTSTPISPSATANPTQTPTQSIEPSASATPTPTYTNTPVPPPPTPTVPMITATINTNCRVGPSKYYDVVGYLLVGQWSQVFGRSVDGFWWYIQNPGYPSSYCWVWGQTTVVSGNTANLPVVAPPPLPTATPIPPPGFGAVYDNTHVCGNQPYAVFKVTNVGAATLESMNLTIDDLTTAVTLSIVNSDIPYLGSPNECPVGAESFPAGTVRYVAGMLGSPAPSGHQARATIKMCTRNNLKGLCTVVTVNFTVP